MMSGDARNEMSEVDGHRRERISRANGGQTEPTGRKETNEYVHGQLHVCVYMILEKRKRAVQRYICVFFFVHW